MLAHQLSAFSKLPPEHPRALGLELCVGGPTLSVVAPGPSTEPGSALVYGSPTGSVMHLEDSFTSGHQRAEKAARLRATLLKSFGMHRTEKIPGTLKRAHRSGDQSSVYRGKTVVPQKDQFHDGKEMRRMQKVEEEAQRPRSGAVALPVRISSLGLQKRWMLLPKVWGR